MKPKVTTKRHRLKSAYQRWPRWALVGLTVICYPIYLIVCFHKTVQEATETWWDELVTMWNIDL